MMINSRVARISNFNEIIAFVERSEFHNFFLTIEKISRQSLFGIEKKKKTKSSAGIKGTYDIHTPN